jgi:hypothetical protein
MRSVLRSSWPYLLGVVLLLHGLAHAVLPLRGAGVLGGDGWYNGLAAGCYMTAMIGFVASGVGAFGVRPFDRAAWWLTLVAAIASMIGFRMLGDTRLWPGMVLDLVLPVAASFLAIPRTPVRHAFGQTVGVLVVVWVSANAVLWPWHRQWGTTPVEWETALPGDAPERNHAFELMHGVTIDAPPEQVWPWLVQIGQERGGFYSYDWLERLFLADIHNIDEIRPEWQQRKVGDFVRAAQPNYLGGLLGQDLGWYITEVQPERALVLHQWGAFVLQSDGGGGTRLFVRSTFSDPRIPVWAAAVSFTAFELPHFIMERRMLLGIKERAERGRSERSQRRTS